MEFLSYALWFIVAIGVLVTVHEFGHFWVARATGRQGAALFGRLRPPLVALPGRPRLHRVLHLRHPAGRLRPDAGCVEGGCRRGGAASGFRSTAHAGASGDSGRGARVQLPVRDRRLLRDVHGGRERPAPGDRGGGAGLSRRCGGAALRSGDRLGERPGDGDVAERDGACDRCKPRQGGPGTRGPIVVGRLPARDRAAPRRCPGGRADAGALFRAPGVRCAAPSHRGQNRHRHGRLPRGPGRSCRRRPCALRRRRAGGGLGTPRPARAGTAGKGDFRGSGAARAEDRAKRHPELRDGRARRLRQDSG